MKVVGTLTLAFLLASCGEPNRSYFVHTISLQDDGGNVLEELGGGCSLVPGFLSDLRTESVADISSVQHHKVIRVDAFGAYVSIEFISAGQSESPGAPLFEKTFDRAFIEERQSEPVSISTLDPEQDVVYEFSGSDNCG